MKQVPEEKGLELIMKERNRQIKKEGYTDSHDDAHNDESLYYAAMAYELEIKQVWPWKLKQFKPTGDLIRDYVKAGALYNAEVDRYTRIDNNPDYNPNDDKKAMACWAMSHVANKIDALLVLKQNGISTSRERPSESIKHENKKLKEAVEYWKTVRSEVVKDFEKDIAQLKSQLAEAREALSGIKTGLWQLSLGTTGFEETTDFSNYVVKKSKELLEKIKS